MAYQSEAELELQFIDQLNKQGYSTVSVGRKLQGAIRGVQCR